MDINFDKYLILDKFNVSRETFPILEQLKNIVIDKNEEINLVSSNTIDNFVERHIIDSAQIIDFIDLNSNICTDLGTGGGFPGVVIAILLRDKKCKIKMNLYEKSYHKSKFLRDVSEKLKLDTLILDKDVFKQGNLISGSILARAFKPLPTILELVEKNFKKYTNLILFMGKNGKQMLDETIKQWEFEYKIKESLTSNDSFLISIKNIKRK